MIQLCMAARAIVYLQPLPLVNRLWDFLSGPKDRIERQSKV